MSIEGTVRLTEPIPLERSSAMRRGVLVVLMMTVAVVLGMSSTAFAGGSPSYFQEIANSLRQHPVYVDSYARPTVTPTQARQLSAEIQSTGRPIYLVLTNQDLVGLSPNQFLAAVHQALGGQDTALIAVGTSKGLYTKGYELPVSTTDNASKLAMRLFSRGQLADHPDPYSLYKQWVTGAVSKMDTGDDTSWEVVLTSIALIAGVLLVAGLYPRWRRWRNETHRIRT